ncbi:hypothetical protein ABEH87_03835 [Erwinia sp. Eh17-17]|uniref:hypothetical protein n=1 Tax=Erwinia sp. Eh17-17 TaxID=3080330 RepID=UPI003207ECA1
MRYQARLIDRGITDVEADDIDTVNINPFAHLGEKDRRVLISENGEPVMVLQLFIRADEDGFLISSAFCGLLCNDRHIAIICGDHLHIFELATGNVRSLPLSDWVGHIYSVPDITSDRLHDQFLVATYCYVFLVDITEGIVWKSCRCAIDGVVIHAIEDGIIYGDGEWDPPGGWEPFELSLINGEMIRMGRSR